jgi:heterodisulfide reductase subunit B
MRYLYYPGCSSDGSSKEYKVSTLAVLASLGAEVAELEGWTCCGASVASVNSELLGLVLPARNLALAESAGGGADMLVGCSACYTNFRRTDAAVSSDEHLLATINEALAEEGLVYHGQMRTRHLLDVLANDFSQQEIAARVRRSLHGLKVAPYYGCQTVRPYSPFDSSERPTSMVGILEALGATVHHHLREASCCGTSLLFTKPDLGLQLVGAILEEAGEADCIATVCPLCQMNLDSYQDRVAVTLERRIPVLFLPQLIGLAFGLPEGDLLLERHIVSAGPVLARLADVETHHQE